ncbi:DUF456 domain-containing protein [Deinococcus cavernae]|uniref:DUF456 domain-containing protein n=1 Tax=Deinococcus cavernae TaxID=2320857 RepID=A0A418V5Y9_9DEIO|nr:DUF456 domain-containing protein [Deinococcus cavernae]RJF71516.1 DUF456 domain-containing protein [Deinococcus cavernae]
MTWPFLVFLVVWVVGVVCTFLPVVPATLIIFAGALVAALMDGYQAAQDLTVILTFGLVAILALVVDNLAASWGARKFGGSKAGMWGALLGGLLSFFIPLPPFNLLIGPVAGALIAELLFERKPLNEALASAWGTLVGLLSGIAAKLALHVLIGLYGLWHFWGR